MGKDDTSTLFIPQFHSTNSLIKCYSNMSVFASSETPSNGLFLATGTVYSATEPFEQKNWKGSILTHNLILT